MNTESGGDSPQSRLSEERKRQIIERDFYPNTKLDQDYNNAIQRLSFQKIGNITPVELYGEYFRNKYPIEADFIIGLSDPKTVAALNRLITEFNSDLERIKQEKDKQAISDFIAKAGKLMGESR